MPVISKEYVSILAALLGGLLGAFGGSWFQNYLDEAASYREEHSTLVQEHIYGFQESLQSLWWRVKNTNKNGMLSEDEYVSITVYAIAKVLAYEHLLNYNGLLPSISDHCPELGDRLINRRLGKSVQASLKYYNRISLSEALLDKSDDRWNVRGFLEFSNEFKPEAWSKDWRFNPVLLFVEKIKTENPSRILEEIRGLANASASCTQVPADWNDGS